MKDNKFKKIVLPIGAVALATLPIVGAISCSNNNGGTPPKPNDPEGNPSQKPEDKVPYLEGTWNIDPTEYNRDHYTTGGKLLFNESDLREIQKKITNNEVKVKNEDGSYVKYEMTITLNPGVTFASSDNVNPNEEYNSDTNQFKVLNKDKPITTSFEIDFDSSYDKEIIGFVDFENTIALAGTDIYNNIYVDSVAFYFDPFSNYELVLGSRERGSEIYIKNKHLFSNVDTPELKYADWTNPEEGKKGKLFLRQLMGRVTNISGTISIKPIISNIND